MAAPSRKDMCRCHGFCGASSVERLPAAAALTGQIRRFNSIPVRKP
jgi:predicted TIM-barrel enzyme